MTAKDLSSLDVEPVDSLQAGFAIAEEVDKLLAQVRRKSLVGIEPEQPRRQGRHVLQRPVPLLHMAFERVRQHSCTTFSGYRNGAVCAAGIHDDDFAVEPIEAVETCGQVELLVVRQNHHRELLAEVPAARRAEPRIVSRPHLRTA